MEEPQSKRGSYHQATVKKCCTTRFPFGVWFGFKSRGCYVQGFCERIYQVYTRYNMKKKLFFSLNLSEKIYCEAIAQVTGQV